MLKQRVPWHTPIVMSPGTFLLCATKGGGPKQGTEGDYDWSALASFKGGLTAQLLPGCLADTGHTSLTNEAMSGFIGVILVHPGQM